MNTIKTFQDLEVYKLSRKFCKDVFETSKKFPGEEKYSLTDQIRRSSRSITANIAEGWGKRIYIDVFKRHLVDSMGSLEETKAWMNSAIDCSYISNEDYNNLMESLDIIGSKIYTLRKNWK